MKLIVICSGCQPETLPIGSVLKDSEFSAEKRGVCQSYFT